MRSQLILTTLSLMLSLTAMAAPAVQERSVSLLDTRAPSVTAERDLAERAPIAAGTPVLTFKNVGGAVQVLSSVSGVIGTLQLFNGLVLLVDSLDRTIGVLKADLLVTQIFDGADNLIGTIAAALVDIIAALKA